ncbi:monovalent cation/H+ antiporter complex subunit F [Nocardioides marmotae]|uniref:Cation:proton antiporter n=1 Tax=Nocardioides marmotae TaxID=2663857 RepID=A0A6I3IZK0_9ACTN|nr:monovalent cation/H+ antiporter complex subunit F [Nocardioides marmotae]MCR6030910.1 cation:proton antiporter [Gordonia jinghuaiqii]MBC9731623.1 cation:proton antiporter [Nocardioides marmotae]MTB82745.1 cation:proton antiporter [Nocardioides marmotae]MTB94547.1 cation:proton antiporter [Nocardioides marmotae]QKE01438.1 cation:proton antiporter [Nocardioides marmotae]
MTVVLVVAGAILVVAALLLVVRMTIGPTILDRSVALDVMVAVTVCAIALLTAHTGETYALPVLVVLAGCAFVSAVSVARYTSRSDDLQAENGDDERAAGRRP